MASAPFAPIWHCQPFDALAVTDLYDILRARNAVFVVEQNCAYQDCDQVDILSHHLWTRDASDEIAAYARLVPPGVKFPEPSIGRVLTSESARGQGIGRALMREAIGRALALYPGSAIRIAAQAYLVRFYEEFGFASTDYEFLEDGIPHVEMLRTG